MGETRDEMTPAKTKKGADKVVDLTEKHEKGFFGKLAGRRNRKEVDETIEVHAMKFADLVDEADKRLKKLISKKTLELQSETGEEAYNRKALALLEIMEYHLDAVIASAAEYSDLKH